jgi:Fe-S cluster biosynthesis and repair protein YggX
MTKLIECKKLNESLPALEYAPLPGEMGLKIQETISAQAWAMWLSHQTMLINEYRLNLTERGSREFLQTEMKKFLFEGGSDKPQGYVPEDDL